VPFQGKYHEVKHVTAGNFKDNYQPVIDKKADIVPPVELERVNRIGKPPVPVLVEHVDICL
jgi:hypothetical protein